MAGRAVDVTSSCAAPREKKPGRTARAGVQARMREGTVGYSRGGREPRAQKTRARDRAGCQCAGRVCRQSEVRACCQAGRDSAANSTLRGAREAAMRPPPVRWRGARHPSAVSSSQYQRKCFSFLKKIVWS